MTWIQSSPIPAVFYTVFFATRSGAPSVTLPHPTLFTYLNSSVVSMPLIPRQRHFAAAICYTMPRSLIDIQYCHEQKGTSIIQWLSNSAIPMLTGEGPFVGWAQGEGVCGRARGAVWNDLEAWEEEAGGCDGRAGSFRLSFFTVKTPRNTKRVSWTH